MPSNRLPRRVLYGELVNGQQLPGGPKLRYMDHIRRILNKCNISTAKLEQLSTDRDTWKSACANGVAIYNVSADQAAEDRRTRRHNPANPPTTVRDAHSAAESVLPSSACAAIYGFMPHVHISNTPSSTNVIVELDGLLQASKAIYGSIHSGSFR